MQELISQLTSKLGVSEDQAQGGAGAIFAFAKDKLDGADFSSLTGAIGGVDDLIAKAPEGGDDAAEAADGGGGLLGGIGGMASKLGLGGALGNLGGLAALSGTFSKLGLSTDKLSGFAEVITNFIKEKSGSSVSGILGKIMG